MRPIDLDKTREIRFARQPPDQVERARRLLDGMQGLVVAPSRHPDRLKLSYSICEYTQAGLEAALASQGFRLDQGIRARLARLLVRFCENVQRLNVAANEPDCKSQSAFVEVYQHHQHGDHDDTPPEWRDYK